MRRHGEERGDGAKGVPLERKNPHPQNTRTLGPLANLRRRDKTRTFCLRAWVDPPEGWVDWVWLMGYKRGGCAKEMKRAELAQ